MALDFPASPVIGQVFTGPNNAVWVWDGTKWLQGASVPVATTNPAYNNVGRNLIHNPLFNIAQRGGGVFTAPAWGLDRWLFAIGGSTGSVQQYPAGDFDRASIGDEAATSVLLCVANGTAGVDDYVLPATQTIEDVHRLAGKTVTLSFYARVISGPASSKLGIDLYQSFGTGGSPSAGVKLPAQAVTLSASWARYSTTWNIPSMAGKTLGTDLNTSHSAVQLWMSAGATYTADSGGIGVQSYTLALWGVQLEIGSVATPLEKPDPQQDLAKCQRFYQIGRSAIGGYQVSGGYISYATTLHQRMRSTPTVVFTDTGSGNVAAPFVNEAGIASVWIAAVATATGGVSIIGNFTASADL